MSYDPESPELVVSPAYEQEEEEQEQQEEEEEEEPEEEEQEEEEIVVVVEESEEEEEPSELKKLTEDFWKLQATLELPSFKENHDQFVRQLKSLSSQTFESLATPKSNPFDDMVELKYIKSVNMQVMTANPYNNIVINNQLYDRIVELFPFVKKPGEAPYLKDLPDLLFVLDDSLAFYNRDKNEADKRSSKDKMVRFVDELKAINLDSLMFRLFYSYFQRNRSSLGAVTPDFLQRLIASDFARPSDMNAELSAEQLFVRQFMPAGKETKPPNTCPATHSHPELFVYDPASDPKNYTYGRLGLERYRLGTTPPLP